MSFLSNGVPHKYAGCRVVSSQKTCSHAPCRPRRRDLVYALFQQKGFSLLLLSFSAYWGCRVTHEKIPGYQSFISDEALSRVYTANCQAITGVPVPTRPHGYYSNDLGDVSKLVPTSQIVVGGFSGALHSERFHIDNEDMAYLLPTKIMACTLIDLLCEEA